MAQFSGSSEVYAYEYEYTNHDGIRSRTSQPEIIFVNFQNGIMDFVKDSRRNVERNLTSNPEYYYDKVLNSVGQTYDKWSAGPRWVQFPSQFNNGSVSAYVYNSDTSTYNTYTYRRLTKSLFMSGHSSPWGWVSELQPRESLGNTCYSFSSDRTSLIIWDVSQRGKRHYYRKVSISELKPNLDFLQ